MELREIEAFLTLADELHFGRTAERLRLSPSRVSQLIQSLEREAGGALFARTSRQVRLTALGSRFLLEAAPSYAGLLKAMASVRDTTRVLTGSLRVGHLPNLGGPPLTDLADAFRQAHPGCEVTLETVTMDRLSEAWYGPAKAGTAPADTGRSPGSYGLSLGNTGRGPDGASRGPIDIVATLLPVDEPGVTIGPAIGVYDRLLVVADDHPLAARWEVSVEDLADHPIPAMPRSIPRALRDSYWPTRTPSGRPIPRVSVPGTYRYALHLVARGELVLPTDSGTARFRRYPGVTWLPIVDLPPARAVLTWRTESPSVRAFARLAAEHPKKARRQKQPVH